MVAHIGVIFNGLGAKVGEDGRAAGDGAEVHWNLVASRVTSRLIVPERVSTPGLGVI